MKPNKSAIIAGRFKGKAFLLPPTEGTRPTKSIVRESFFNTVQDFLDEETAFVEVFGGSGSMGLEAASRGVGHLYFLEQNSVAVQTLKKNLKAFGLEAKVLEGDSFQRVREVYEALDYAEIPALYYMDPPFAIRENFSDIYEKVCALIRKIPHKARTMVVVEHASEQEFTAPVGDFIPFKNRRFGKTSLTYFLPGELLE